MARDTTCAEALELLDALIELPQKRLGFAKLLIGDEGSSGWHMHVPWAFNEALGIKAPYQAGTIWRQRSWFAFSKGDVLYDTPRAYEPWEEALKVFRLCIQVVRAVRAIPILFPDVKKGKKGAPRKPGRVRFKTFTPDGRKSGLTEIGEYSVTQDDFIRFLIAGPSAVAALRRGIWP